MARNKGGHGWAKWVGLPLFVISIFVLLYGVFVPDPRSKQVQTELENELRSITPFPQAALIHSERSHKRNQVLVSDRYSVPASHAELRSYYDKELARCGWRFVSEKQLTRWGADRGGRDAHYCKGEWSANIEYVTQAADNKADYALSLSWGLDKCS